MKPLQLGFVYNVRHQPPDPLKQTSHLDVDLDDPETIEWMVKHLESLGHNIVPIEADERAYLKLFEVKESLDLVFNYSLGIHGTSGYAQLPAMLEMLEIPYTGPGVLSQALVMNKAMAKTVMRSHRIPTLPFQVFVRPSQTLKKGLDYPLLVKPVARGSSAGVTNESVVNDGTELKRQVSFIWETFNEPALVEPFLKGREFSIGMIGSEPTILPMIEPNHALLPDDYQPIDSFEVKWIFEEETDNDYLRCPAEIDEDLQKKLGSIVKKVWSVFELKDFCRIDIRCNCKGKPFVLDINSPAGLIPPEISMTSYLPLAAREDGIDYPKLLDRIIRSAMKRYNTDKLEGR